MKPLPIVFAACLVPAIPQAQNAPQKNLQIVPGTSLRFDGKRYFMKPLNDSNTLSHFSFPVTGKPGVHRLRQDGMPCIVPDSNKTVRITNLWRGSTQVPYKGNPPRIPNPGLRPDFLAYRTR